MATSRPPPRATPWIAATVGFLPPSRTSQIASLMLLSMPPPPAAAWNWLISKPAEKLLPEPVTTMAWTEASSCARFRLANKLRSTAGQAGGSESHWFREGHLPQQAAA